MPGGCCDSSQPGGPPGQLVSRRPPTVGKGHIRSTRCTIVSTSCSWLELSRPSASGLAAACMRSPAAHEVLTWPKVAGSLTQSSTVAAEVAPAIRQSAARASATREVMVGGVRTGEGNVRRRAELVSGALQQGAGSGSTPVPPPSGGRAVVATTRRLPPLRVVHRQLELNLQQRQGGL